jgi:hypothetical protein
VGSKVSYVCDEFVSAFFKVECETVAHLPNYTASHRNLNIAAVGMCVLYSENITLQLVGYHLVAYLERVN